MAYIGNQQTQGFSSRPSKQDLTGATGTSLTLSHAVASAEGIDLFINNVRQEPTTAYSIAGDGVTVTLTGSVVATDDIYVVYNSLALQTTVTPDASVSTAKIIDGNVTAAKLATSLDMQNITLKGGTTDAISIDSSGRVEIKQNNTATSTYAASGAWTISGVPDWSDKIKFVSYGVSAASAGEVYIRVTVGGTAVQGTAYKYNETRISNNTLPVFKDFGSGVSEIKVDGYNNVANLFNWILEIYKVDTNIYNFKATKFNTQYTNNSFHFMGTIETSGAIDGFQLIASGGNFDGGKARLFWE